MGFIIIDAHSHLWLKQDAVVEGLPIRTLSRRMQRCTRSSR